MSRLQVILGASAASLVAMALLWRRIVALASGIIFVTNLPAQHRENIRAIAELTEAIKQLTGKVDQLRRDLDRTRRR